MDEETSISYMLLGKEKCWNKVNPTLNLCTWQKIWSDKVNHLEQVKEQIEHVNWTL